MDVRGTLVGSLWNARVRVEASQYQRCPSGPACFSVGLHAFCFVAKTGFHVVCPTNDLPKLDDWTLGPWGHHVACVLHHGQCLMRRQL